MNIMQLAEAILRIQNAMENDHETNVIINDYFIEVTTLSEDEPSFESASIRAGKDGLILEITTHTTIK